MNRPGPSAMTLPRIPPPIEMSNDTKRAIIDGIKEIIEILKAAGRVAEDYSYSKIIREPRDLYRFIKAFRNISELVGAIVKDIDGQPVTAFDVPLECGVTLAQIQHLLTRTCARHFLERENREDEKIVTETVKKKVLGLFTTTKQVERKTGGGFDERRVREISRNIAFDWQLPLLPAYNMLSTSQLSELGDDLIYLQSFDAIREYLQIEAPTAKRAKAVAGEEFVTILATKPSALPGVATWSRDMYIAYRRALGDKSLAFFARDKEFFLVCSGLDKPLVSIYGEVLEFIEADNLSELQRLNIDKTEVLLQAMKTAFGVHFKEALTNANFAKDILRRLVESMQHITQEKAQLAQSALITCRAVAPQVISWVEKQKSGVEQA